MKQNWKPGTMIYPLPAVLVSCGDASGLRNLLTVAWTGTVCTDPPMGIALYHHGSDSTNWNNYMFYLEKDCGVS